MFWKDIIRKFNKRLQRNMSWWRLALGPVFFILIQLNFPTENFESYPQMGVALALAAWMITWWVLEPLPIYITAFLPLILGPNLQLGTLPSLAAQYGNEMVFLFLGGFMIARAIEKYDIHRNIAALIVKRTGTSPIGVLLGFMIATAFLSMWLSNTGTTIMMLPMAMTVLNPIPEGKFKTKYTLALLLSIAYSANIGGIATLIGSPPNLVMAGVLKQSHNIDVDFITWSAFGLPISIVLILLMYWYFKKYLVEKDATISVAVGRVNPWTNNQKRVLYIFAATVIFWTFKPLINEITHFPLKDPQIALTAALVLFIYPKYKSDENLLNWNDTKETPWGILFLFGGGLALASCLETGGVLNYFADSIQASGFSNFYLLLIVLVISSIFFTELMSNLALISILIPIVSKIAEALDMEILALALPITIAASCAFMLPMATPPNAIIFSSEKIEVKQMVRIGFVLNVLAIIVIFAVFSIYNALVR